MTFSSNVVQEHRHKRKGIYNIQQGKNDNARPCIPTTDLLYHVHAVSEGGWSEGREGPKGGGICKRGGAQQGVGTGRHEPP